MGKTNATSELKEDTLMMRSYFSCTFRNFLLMIGMMAALLFVSGCGDPNSVSPQGQQTSQKSAMTQMNITRPVQTPFFQLYSTGTGSGVHISHNGIACKTCHLVAGAVQFDPTSAAIVPGTLKTDSSGAVIVNAATGTVAENNVLIPAQLPTYNPTNGICANIACHWVKPGNYYYYNDADEQNEVAPYGTALPKTTPDWYSTPGAALCSACHGYPPYDAPNQYIWHSSWHGGVSVGSTNPDVIGFNYCSTCHPDVTSKVTNGTLITTINAANRNGNLHGNGVVDVVPNWGLSFLCSQCHGG
jgi:predicted CxxxxCH...CXXCH cytochrome family protein